MPNQIRALSAPASGWNHDVSGGLGTPEPATGVPSPAAGPSVHPRSLAATGRQLTRDEDHRVEARFSNGEWYPATVVSINDDGSLEVGIPRACVRSIHAPPRSKNLTSDHP